MNLEKVTLPPVSKQFYETLVECFPPLNPLDITEDTTMISIQRNAAQQEVINMVRAGVVETEVVVSANLWDKFNKLIRKK
jgi:hypothetical protein